MKLPLDELLVLDWVFCAQGEKAISQLRDELMRFSHLRERVWRAILLAALESATPAEAVIELHPSECEELLALVPTTFRWGTGNDVGFSLKQRLAEELWGAEERERYEGLAKMKALYGGQDASSTSNQPNADTNAYAATD